MRGLRIASLAVALALIGCEKHDAPPADEPVGHRHISQHGGTLVELGDEAAHVELVLDRAAGKLTAYVLDGEAEAAVRVVQPTIEVAVTGAAGPVALKAVASGLTGETVGDTSQFETVDPAFAKPGPLEGKIVTVTVPGRAFKDVPFSVP